MEVNVADILTEDQKAKLGEKIAANLMKAADKVDYVSMLTDDFFQILESEYIFERIGLDTVANEITKKLVSAVKKLK